MLDPFQNEDLIFNHSRAYYMDAMCVYVYIYIYIYIYIPQDLDSGKYRVRQK